MKLRSWIRVIQTAILGVIVIEGILVVLIGIASNKLGESVNHWSWILFGSVVVYLFVMVIKAAYQIKFPSSIVDELISSRQLEIKNSLFERQKAINGFITASIQGLNRETCQIPPLGGNGNLCDKELQQSLTELLKPIVSYTDVILDTGTEKYFSIGIHLESYFSFPNDLQKVELEEEGDGVYVKNSNEYLESGILMLKDELNLFSLLPKKLVTDDRASGPSYEIQTCIKRTLNNLSFNSGTFTFNRKDYSIICSEILEICSDEYVNGVLFIIYKNGVKYPEDVPEILSIFNRITANFVSKYNSCILDEIIKRKSKVS